MMKNILAFLLVLVALLSCNSSQGPQDTLRKYIEHRFSQNQNLDFLKSLTTGELLNSLASIQGEDRKLFLDTSNLKLKKFKVLNQTCTESTCTLGYVLSYLDITNGNSSETEVKKLASLSLVDGKWLLVDVSNIHTAAGPTR